MRIAGLFSGIGGLELGLEQAGHQVTSMCEIEPAAQAVLRTRFPAVRLIDDARSLDRVRRGTDLIAAGFPCQDLSQAGTARGIRGRKSGVITTLFRILERSSVPFVLIENVPFILKLGGGQGIRVVVQALEQLGYSWAYRVVDTRAFGIPQRRRRVFLLASRETDPTDVLLTTEEPSELMEGHRGHPVGFYWTEGLRGLGWAIDSIPTLKGGSGVGIPSAPAIWMPDGMIGTPEIEDAERLQGFPAGWTKPAALVAPRGGYRWRLLGNAVTVDVARWIGARLHGRRNGGRLGEVRELHASDPWPSAAFGVPGIGRFAVQASSWPVARRRRTLSEFLRHDLVPLSERATLGFLSRLGRSRLLRPPEFDAALRKHAARMRRRPATPLASRANRVGEDPGGDGHTTGLARPA